MARKEYELKIEEVPELESTVTAAFQSKGHHNRLAFANAVKQVMTDEKYKDCATELIRKLTLHLWAKSVPWCGGGRKIVYSIEHKAGWYPVTVLKVHHLKMKQHSM